jgi:hypothetical protein
MQGRRAFKRGRVFFFIVIGGAGYLLGIWHAAAVRTPGLSPAQTVALRFPEDLTDVAPDSRTGTLAASRAGAARAAALGNAQLVLLDPSPMVPRPAVHEAAPVPVVELPPGVAPAPPHATAPIPLPVSRTKTTAVAIHQQADRPSAMLNDGQIASIKTRLHLTPDQETMWPAVEAALRNVAYVQARAVRRGGGHANATQLAAADPDSVEVEGLKAAALPLIMSFSAEQKSEARNIAHVMGLDQLASQF